MQAPDKPFDKEKEVIKPLTEWLWKEISEISEFLKWNELGEKDYIKEYEKIKTKIDTLDKDIKDYAILINKNKQSFTDEEWNNIVDLTERFKNIKKMFSNSIISPEKFKEKLENEKIIDLWSIPIKSSWDDIPLTPDKLMQLKPEKLLAKTGDNVLYYKITLDWTPMILRYNSKKDWDEIALYKNFTLPDNYKNDDIRRFIISVERQWAFQDIEMQDSKSVSNIWMVASWLVTSAWLTAWWVAGLWATTWVVWWASTWLAGVTWIFSNPIWWAVGLWAAWWVVIWGVVAAATDLDYTSEDYNQDFSWEIGKLNSSIWKTNYIKK